MKVLIVGGGIAGLTAALHARESGHDTTLIVKGTLGDGSTRLAQGGIAGAHGEGDSPAAHAEDTLAAGAGLCDPDAVDVLVNAAAERIAELVARGVAFDRDSEKRLLLGREAAHSAARIAHAGGDATGAAISHALVDAVRRADISVSEHAFLVDVLTDPGGACGALLLIDGARRDVSADAVILATGGAGQLFAHTTNPAEITGDGIAAALRAGAVVRDLEFVQFHPTILVAPGPAFLVSEAVRGDGAVLVDADGRRFMLDEHPEAELAPRDVVARAVARHASAQDAPVRLDATGLGAELLAARFPTIDRVTRERGFDWARDPIPVTPAAHYLMGGVATDLNGRSTVPGLFAVGEVARTGVHGANRLASNSLLEGAVFAARAVAALEEPRRRGVIAPAAVRAGTREHPVVFDTALDPHVFSRAALQELMWAHAGLLRTADGLAAALSTVRAWRSSRPAPRTVAEHEDANLLALAEEVTTAALARPASVGAHHLDTHPALIGVA